MNKFLKLLIFAALLVSSGIVYQKFYRPEGIGPIKATGSVVEIKIRAKENQWKWEPSNIKVKGGDLVRLHIYNEDDYDHGFAIEAFGVNKRLFPRRETVIEFVASRSGSFQFYCSVPCGEGHYEQIGTIFVED